ncbi:MAG: tRNA (N(6)-L-threonylcarbamoyladenosine(37)-C(2))-methylthiotransferase MtaB [Syntrophotaleaceae bacterium]
MNRTCAIATLGCKTNQFESAAMEELLAEAGFTMVAFDQGADLVIVNTCTVTAATDSQSRNLIRRARRLNPACRIVVTGCYAQVDPGPLAALPGVAVVIGNEEKRRLPEILAEGRTGIQVSDIRSNPGPAMTLTSFAGRSRAFLQIQNGCDAFCSYCIIPYARGPSRSVSVQDVIRQVDRLAAGGYAEVVLTGIHVGAYGRDLEPPVSLLELVDQILLKTPVSRLRLGSIEPLEMSLELIRAMADSARICSHVHIPLQSGDDAVLKRMNRNYGREGFRRLVEDIRLRLPEAAIGCDVITGFPGETDREFTNTLQLIEELPVTHLHVFPFSRRPGTPAASMAGQVPGPVARERAALLRDLGHRKLADFAKGFVGQRLEVVIEGRKRGGRGRGLTGNYLSVNFSCPADLEGQLLPVLIENWNGEALEGRLP